MVEAFNGLTQEYKDMLFTRFNPSRIEEEFSQTEARLIVFFPDSASRKQHSSDLRFILSAHFSNFGFFIPSGDSVLISFKLDSHYKSNGQEPKWRR